MEKQQIISAGCGAFSKKNKKKRGETERAFVLSKILPYKSQAKKKKKDLENHSGIKDIYIFV